jgi:tetratricopeptide (TPR) repeat protein/GTP-binding protein EngB required for normal cell division
VSFWSRIERRLTDLAGELIPDEFRDQIGEARALLAAGEAAEAAESLEALVETRPDHALAQSLLGAARLELGDFEEARLAFERAIAADPDLSTAHLGRGETSAMLGDDDTAEAAYRTAVGAAGGNRTILHEAYRGLGAVYHRRGEIDKAVRELRKAVAEEPRDALALAALGDALLSDREVTDEEAERWLRRAVDADGEVPITYLALGRLALRGDRFGDARSQFDRALELLAADRSAHAASSRADKLRALLGLGDACLGLGEPSEANRFYLQALEIDPKRAEVHARIADVHRAVGNPEAALPSYDRALALGAGEEVLRRALDTALAARRTADAVRLANQLLEGDPDDARALVARGMALADDGQTEAAMATFRSALSRGDDPEAHLALGRLELTASPARIAGTNAAVAALAALRIEPHSARARALLADGRGRELAIRAGDADGGDRDGALYRAISALSELTVHSREIGDLSGDAARAAADYDQPLLVTVMGEFSSGKSTFVNAFIGDDVAPTGITPTTATINVVKYGRERGGRIVYQSGAARELGWDELLAALRALDADEAREIRLVEILVPLAELERINIVDTPGLNSILPEHEDVARGFISRADAVVWLFTANQAGKKSEREALQRIRDEGVRVLGVLNKMDQLATGEVDQVVDYVAGELDGLVEAIVPFSARDAVAWRESDDPSAAADGNWSLLSGSLEERFFARAREIKREICARRLGGLIARAQSGVGRRQETARSAAAALRDAAVTAREVAGRFAPDVADRQRSALNAEAAELYRSAAREILDLVRPRRLPFGSHTATAADRDYLISLLGSGYEALLERARKLVVAELRIRGGEAIAAVSEVSGVVGSSAVSDVARTVEDAVRLVEAQVFARCRAYLSGYLHGGYVDNFFRRDLPKIDLSVDAIYHALYRDSPDLDAEIGAPLERAGDRALTDLADRLDHWSGVADVLAYDLEVGIGRALDEIDAVRRAAEGSSR